MRNGSADAAVPLTGDCVTPAALAVCWPPSTDRPFLGARIDPRDTPKDDGFTPSRREFFKTVGAGSLAGAVVTAVAGEAEARPAAAGPGEVPITLTINGQRHALRVEPRVTLLDAMRTRLELTGQKRVCDRGACGACTVIVDGRTYYSCSLLAIEAQGRNIRTGRRARPGRHAPRRAAGLLRPRRADVRVLHAGLRDGRRWRCSRRRRRRRPSRHGRPSTATCAAAAPTSA